MWVRVLCASAVNVKKVAELESKTKDAEENQGESEILDAALETAEHYYRIGDEVDCNHLFFGGRNGCTGVNFHPTGF